jgi:hypothetical protein
MTTDEDPAVSQRVPLVNEYAGCEGLRGRLRAPVPIALFYATWDRANHDPGDEDRSER